MILLMAVAIPSTIALTACETTVEGRNIREIIPDEEVRLQKMRSSVGQAVSVEGSWFLFGSVRAETGPEARAYFSWPLRDGSYAISSLPIERIRVRLMETVDNPTINFQLVPSCSRWDRNNSVRHETLQAGIDSCVAYATITCVAKDWQPSVQMPLK